MSRKAKPAHAYADDQIAAGIRQALKLDHDVPDELVSVQVRDGVVTLEGDLQTLAQKDIAERDARNVKGVRSVISRIAVRGETFLGSTRV